MPIESLVSVVFYRGLTMQVAVERDASGRSNYSMCAVNPSRISKTFNEEALRFVVSSVAEETGWLLEIVNYNIANMQYVCAGDLRALDTLAGVTNFLKMQKIDIDQMKAQLTLEEVKAHLGEIIRGCARKTEAQGAAAGAGARLRDDPAARHRRALPLDVPAQRRQAVPVVPAQEDQQDDDRPGQADRQVHPQRDGQAVRAHQGVLRGRVPAHEFAAHRARAGQLGQVPGRSGGRGQRSER